MRKIELLVPASSLEVLKDQPLYYGADAVYIGGEAFGLRAKGKELFNKKTWQKESLLPMSMV